MILRDFVAAHVVAVAVAGRRVETAMLVLSRIPVVASFILGGFF